MAKLENVCASIVNRSGCLWRTFLQRGIIGSVNAIYDRIGGGYSSRRKPDPRIAAAIVDALDGAVSVVNVGAGTGSYEPQDRPVVAVEPSQTMIRQRPIDAAPAVQATADALPFRDDAFDASLAVLTMHHWQDQHLGMTELRRVSRRRAVILTWDPRFDSFWLTDYLPQVLDVDRGSFTVPDEFFGRFGEVEIQPVAIPSDCVDGFLCAYWSRPHAYLDPNVRAGMSTFAKLDEIDSGLARLERDLADGSWDRQYGDIRCLPSLDLGYVLVTVEFQ